MNLSGKKLTTAILAGLMGATMFGGSVFADSALEAVQTLALQNSNQIDVLTGRVDKLAAASSDATQNTKDIATNKDNIAKNAGAITTNEKAIADEATARTDADTKLNTRITNVKEYLENQTAANYVSKTDAAVQDGAVVKADNTIGENVTNLDGALAKETAARIGADKAQDAVIQQVNQNVADGFKAINNNIGTITDQLNKNDLAEQQARAAKDTEHDNAIAANKQAISTTNTYVEQNMQGISDNRDSIGKINGILNGTDGTGNSGLIKQVNDNTTGIADEAKTRADADTALDNKKADKSYVTQKFSAVGEQLDKQSDRITTAQNGVNANAKQIDANKQQIAKNVETLDNHEGRITGNETNIANNATNISKEISARQDADQNLQTQINNNNTSVNNEAAERKAADQNLQNQINNNSTSINDLYGRYSSLKTDINKVGARSAALAGLHPLDFDPANKLNFAVASGSFKGENSVALGAFYRPNENIMFSAASTMGDSDNAYTFGLSFKIGPSSAKTKTTSPDAEELYKVVGELQDQLAAQQKEIEQLKANKAK